MYWTLEYELFFYLVVGIIIQRRFRRWFVHFFVAWIAVMVLVRVGHFGDIFGLARPYPAFASGALIATGIRSGWTWPRVLALAAGWWLTVTGEIGYSAQLAAYSGQPYSRTIVALLISSFFAVLLLHQFTWFRSLHIPGARAAGNLTYPVYLTHAYIGYMMLNAFARPDNLVWFYPLLLVAALGLAWGVHKTAEVWPRPLWKRLFGGWVNWIGDLVVRRPPRPAATTSQGDTP